MGSYAWFILFEKVIKSRRTKRIIISAISKSAWYQFQNYQARYARETKCSNFYIVGVEIIYILSITGEANHKQSKYAWKWAGTCTKMGINKRTFGVNIIKVYSNFEIIRKKMG